MLFFFEAGFFVLAVAALIIAESWGRAQTVLLWLVLTVVSLAARPLARAYLARQPATDRREMQWRGAVTDSWRHFNLLLLLGLLGLGGWWWLGQR
jgi:hypothetical protein